MFFMADAFFRRSATTSLSPRSIGLFVWSDGVYGSSLYGYHDSRGTPGWVCVVATRNGNVLCTRGLDALCGGCCSPPFSLRDSRIHGWFTLLHVSLGCVYLLPLPHACRLPDFTMRFCRPCISARGHRLPSSDHGIFPPELGADHRVNLFKK